MSMIEPESLAPNQPPTIMIRRVYDASGPGPHDDDFCGVQTPKLFEAPDGHGNLRSRKKEFWQEACHIQHASKSGPLAVTRGYHLFEGGEI